MPISLNQGREEDNDDDNRQNWIKTVMSYRPDIFHILYTVEACLTELQSSELTGPLNGHSERKHAAMSKLF